MRRLVLFGLLGVVAAAAAVLSFAALRDLALLCGFSAFLAWLLPVVVDAGAAAGALVWLTGWAPGPARRFARALALMLLASSVAANALGHGLDAFGLAPPWWVVVAVSAIAPAVLGAVVHLAVLVGRADSPPPSTAAAARTPVRNPQAAAVGRGLAPGVDPAYDRATAVADLPVRWGGALDGRAAAVVAASDVDVRVVELVELLTAGSAVTGAQAAALFGCSPRTGRRLLTRAQQVCTSGEPTDPGSGQAELTATGWMR